MNLFEILQAITIDGNVARIQSKLERNEYIKVNEVLEVLGGSWNRKSNGHVFPFDPTESINEVIKTQVIPPKNPHAYFPTPSSIIEDMLVLAEYGYYLASHFTILEPSIGTGHIVKHLRSKGYSNKVIGFEVDPLRAAIARKDESTEVFEQDFLTSENVEADLVLMNPPFAVDGNKTCYIDHVYKAWQCLKPQGKLVGVVPQGFITSSIKKVVDFREFVGEHGFYSNNEKDAFKESGTRVSTSIIVLEKHSEAELDTLFNQEYAGYLNSFVYILMLRLENDAKLYSEAKNAAKNPLLMRNFVLKLVELERKEENWMPFREEWVDYFTKEIQSIV